MTNDSTLACPQAKLEELESKGYIFIRDKGFTELEPNTLTCVNLGIIDCNNINEYGDNPVPKYVKRLRLYK